MRLKIIGGLISFLLIVLSVLLFIEDYPKTEIIVSPKIYSIIKSSDTELFSVVLLVNDIDSYYFNKDYISSIKITSDRKEIIPCLLDNIKKSSELHIYEEEAYYYLTLELSIGFDSDDYAININNAYLDISYSNTNEISLFIGEFNYYFYDEENTDISLNNLLATHAYINDIDTASGLFLNLGNMTDYNITINKIEIGSNDVLANNYYLKEIYNIPDISATPSEILNIDNYNYAIYGEYSGNNILFRRNNEIMIYVPFSYTGDINYLYRFYVKVYYVLDSEEKVFVIDDFPYINTSSYKEELESEYYYYEFDN